MRCSLYDAHCHLADTRLIAETQAIQSDLHAINCRYSIVNGTSPLDWQRVIDYCSSHSQTLTAIGLHPWQVNKVSTNWHTQFEKALDNGVKIIGEIGLDQWIEGHDIAAQQAAFRWQLTQAAERNLPVSIHCLKAIDPLMQTLKTCALPRRGIHLHALNVSVEAARELIDLGTYFSFNSGQLKSNAKHIFKLIRAIPLDHILVETDAPDFLPSETYRTFNLDDESLNHPANLGAAYEAIAAVRDESFETFCNQVENNFKRYFLE